MSAKFNEFWRHGTRRWWATGATLVAVAVVSVVFVAASGANLTGSTFEGNDGNMTVETGTDWATAGLPVQTLTDLPSGSTDNAFGQGTKEDDTAVTIVNGTIPPNKNDLVRSYLSNETVGGQTFLYLAWIRAANTGDAHIDFELNQQPTAGFTGSTTGNLTLNRTVNDLLISYDFSGSGTPDITLFTWNGSAWGNPVDLSAQNLAEAAVNTASFTDALAGGTVGVGDFGEASINLSQIPGVFAPNTCESFGSTFVKSRSSGSSTSAELKDFIAPAPIHVSNCGSIELKKHWVGTAGNATLNIGTTAGAHDTAQTTVSGQDGTTGPSTVKDGTYYVSESGVDSNLYSSSLACTDNGSSVTPGGTNSLSVTAGHTVVCTYTNTRKGSIELKKHWVGTAGNATLNIGTSAGDSQTATATANGQDGTTGAKTVSAGTYYVSELVTNASDYTSALACTDNGNTVAPGASSSLTVADGHTVVCTYTNTRNQGSIELKKHWVGTAGNVTLNIGTAVGGGQTASTSLVGADGTTEAKTVDTGTYYVSESVTNASDYTSTLACTDNNSPVTPGANSSLSVGSGHTVVCTYTNTRNQGSIELKKHWVGTAGNVTLNIGTSAGGSQTASTSLVGADGTTGPKTVDTGTYYVSESFDSPTSSADYATALVCTDNGSPVTPGTDNALAVAKGDTVVCTLTNTRVQGSVELKKHWVGTAGNVTLNIGTDAGGSQVTTQHLTGTDGSTGAHGVDTGTYYVSESFDSPTNGDNYSPTLACFNDLNNNGSQDNGEPDVTPSEQNGFDVGAGDHVVCTFTNRELPQLELVKSLVPSQDTGTFDLAIGDQSFTNDGNGYGDQGTTGFVHIQPGAPTISESGHGDTSLSDYDSSISCDNGDSGSGTSLDLSNLSYGDKVTCTFTNSRLPTITIGKRVVPPTDTGTFDFTIDPGERQLVLDNDSHGYGNNGSTGAVDVSPGTHTISESGNGDTNASDYASTWSCSNETHGTGTTIDPFALDYGDNVTCTFTNTKLATLIVKKVVDNSNGGGSKVSGDFSIHVTTAGLDLPNSPAPGSSSGTTYSGLLPGLYTVSEDAVSGYSLTGNTCAGGVNIDPGATVTCTLTNKSAAPPPPPPPPPPAPKVDLQITKTATPNPAILGNAVTWTMVVTNNGPNGATGVTVGDPLPAGTTFVSVTTSQGTCTGGALVSCQLGNMPVGTSVTITLVTTTNATGTLTNTATTVANEQETNTANNTASASVVINGPFVPPVKPPTYCTAVAVSPKSLFVGRTHVLTVRVSSHGKAKAGVRVRIKGASLSIVTTPSNAKGLVKRSVKPTKAGIVVFVPVAQKSCKNPRIGVIGVFTPPVTG